MPGPTCIGTWRTDYPAANMAANMSLSTALLIQSRSSTGDVRRKIDRFLEKGLIEFLTLLCRE